MTGEPAPPAAEPEASADWMAVVGLMRGAYAEKTLRETVKCYRLFAAWCDGQGEAAFPATSGTVAAYVETVFRRYATRTVESQLSLIRRLHVIGGHPDPTRGRDVRLAFRRGVRAYGRPSRQAHALSAELRDRLLAACGEDLLGLRDRALVGLGYDTLCRRSELVALQVEDLAPNPAGGATVTVRASKTNPLHDGRPASISARTLAEVDAWLAAAGIGSGAILRRVRFTKACRGQLHPKVINQRLRALAEQADLDPALVKRLTSHSFRVGAARDLAASGRTLLDIMRAGRWRGLDSVALYVRDAPVHAWPVGDGDTFPVAQYTPARRTAHLRSPKA